MKRIKSLLPLITAIGASFVSSDAAAHVLPSDTPGFLHGLGHPFIGVDHLLAMIAVGLWAMQLGGKQRWTLPMSFVGCMIVGGLIGMSGVSVPWIEQGISASVLMLGALLAVPLRVRAAWASMLVGLFALFHGFAHGAEMPAASAGATYLFGLTLATAVLHGLGIFLAAMAQRVGRTDFLRAAGGLIAMIGCVLLLQS